MKSSFHELESVSLKNPVKMTNHLFNKIIDIFVFRHISKNNIQDIDINRKSIQSKIIIIDKYEEFENEYFQICFDYFFFFIDTTNIFLIKEFFEHNLDSTFYSLSADVADILSNNIGIKPKNIIFEDSFFEEEISNFCKNFRVLNQNLKKVWNHIQRCLAGFLIKKGYSNSCFDRMRAYGKMLNINNEDFDITKNNHIKLRVLGHGNSSNVYLIYHIEKEQIFALKIFNCKDQESEKLFTRENNNYMSLYHPFTAHYFGSFNIDSYYCIVLEYIDGKNLNFIKEMNLSINDKFKIIFETMIIIEYLHSKKFIYRDLKPNNLMLNKKKTLILIDLDRMIDQSNNINRTKNFNHDYCAPELITNNFSFDADIYSLGLLIYYIFFEKHPRIKYDDSGLPIEFPFHEFPQKYCKLRNICEKCTDIDPSKRPNISYLIDTFYLEFYSKVPIQIPETDTIKTNENIHNSKCTPYWVYVAEKNDPYCLFKLGSFYNFGQFLTGFIHIDINYRERYVPYDLQKVVLYYKFAADLNASEAQYNLGLLYIKGVGVSKNINKGIYYLQRASDQNESSAQYVLGNFYNDNRHIQRDENKAIYYFQLAADQGNVKAIFNLGNIYLGKNRDDDLKKAIHYFSIGAKLNDSKSLNNLALIYSSKGYAFRDMNKAIEYYTRAANNNFALSQYNLGSIYEEGKYIKRDINKAIYYYKLASEQNYSSAQFSLGLIYYNGEYIPKNIDMSIHYFSLAASNNNVDAFYILGSVYLSGEYIEQDINKAIYYYTRAANCNHQDAQLDLGLFYYSGVYVPKNIKKGIFYLSLAAKYGCKEANFYLGYIYFENKIFPRNIEKTVLYYKEASSFNNQYAKNNLAVIFKNGYDVEKNIGYAIILLKEAIKQKEDVVSMFNLANIYFFDDGFSKKIDKCIKLLVKSMLNNFDHSKHFLYIILIKKYGEITLDIIKNEIYKYENNEELSLELFEIFNKYRLEDYDFLYNYYREMNLIYDDYKNPIVLDYQIKFHNKFNQIPNITDEFYKGFELENES